jgi:hypothetical protein
MRRYADVPEIVQDSRGKTRNWGRLRNAPTVDRMEAMTHDDGRWTR